MATRSRSRSSKSKRKSKPARRCGLCGNTTNLTRTDCCRNWICDDADRYVMFSYARNSCYRNHDRYTLCAAHHHERHLGGWKTCSRCRTDVETEMYVWYGTNEYNFEVLENPPDYEPTRCSKCKRIIRLATEGHAIVQGKYLCDDCSGFV